MEHVQFSNQCAITGITQKKLTKASFASFTLTAMRRYIIFFVYCVAIVSFATAYPSEEANLVSTDEDIPLAHHSSAETDQHVEAVPSKLSSLQTIYTDSKGSKLKLR